MPRLPRATITRDTLLQLYVQEHLTLTAISARTGVPITTLGRWRREWDIPFVEQAESYVGLRFGRWTVLSQTPGGHRGSPTICHCCCDCGTLQDIPRGNLQQGLTHSCGCLFRKPEGWAGFNKVIDGYKRSAQQRGLEYALPIELAAEITKQPCYYCGIAPQQIRKDHSVRSHYVYNGIDRVDNALGYVEGNVVPGCWQCNRTKRGHSVTEFLNWARKIHPLLGAQVYGGFPVNPQFRDVFDSYRSKARHRKLAFSLTKEQMMGLFLSDCAYCGAPPTNGKPGSLYSGIDRVDNALGYHPSNCVPACQPCNFAKLGQPLETFLEWASRVQHHSTSISMR